MTIQERECGDCNLCCKLPSTDFKKDYEAVEIYPNEKRLVDTANQYHLFVFPKDYLIPFGWHHRTVDAIGVDGGVGKRGQRAIEERTNA